MKNLHPRTQLAAYFTTAWLALACFGLSPQARAVCQQGCDLSNANTFLGDDALVNNTTGTDNTANGSNALHSNTTGFQNTATGFDALSSNTTGFQNTATGFHSLQFNTTGEENTAVGVEALFNNTTGWHNTALGWTALANNSTGNNNVALGSEAGLNCITGSNNIHICNRGIARDSNTIRIGSKPLHNATFIAGISGATVPTGVAVIVDTNGHLGTTTSSSRFKDQIKPMDKASEAILALKPVTFVYKKEIDSERIPQFGLVAEQVEKVNPDLVARDEQGKPYTVRYEAVNAMLLNEFLKEHGTDQELKTTVVEQQAQIRALTAASKRKPRKSRR